MQLRHRSALALVALGALTLPALISGQGATIQRPPRITPGALAKPTVTPGKFKPATLPIAFTPEKPVNENGALIGYGSYDFTEGRISVRSGETGQFVGARVMLSKLNRPVTFDIEITGTDRADDKIRLQLSEQVRKPDGTFQSKTLNMITVDVLSMRQRLSITGSPSGEGWIQVMATPATTNAKFDLVSITVRG